MNRKLRLHSKDSIQKSGGPYLCLNFSRRLPQIFEVSSIFPGKFSPAGRIFFKNKCIEDFNRWFQRMSIISVESLGLSVQFTIHIFIIIMSCAAREPSVVFACCRTGCPIIPSFFLSIGAWCPPMTSCSIKCFQATQTLRHRPCNIDQRALSCCIHEGLMSLIKSVKQCLQSVNPGQFPIIRRPLNSR